MRCPFKCRNRLNCGCGDSYCLEHDTKYIRNAFGPRFICQKCKSMRKQTDSYFSKEFIVFPQAIEEIILDYAFNFHHVYRRNPKREENIRRERKAKKCQ